MRVLIACEFSGVVRNAFRALGHEAWSCDLLPAEDDSPWHIQGDALAALRAQDWGLVIAHPPCTYLCNSGVRWLYGGKGKNIDLDRWAKMRDGAYFFECFFRFYGGPLCVENPVMHGHAFDLLCETVQATPRQTIQPYDYGHPETKRTCLWLRGLPLLKPNCIVRNEFARLSTAERSRVHYASPGPNRWKERSRTLPGIAAAFASQWGQNQDFPT